MSVSDTINLLYQQCRIVIDTNTHLDCNTSLLLGEANDTACSSSNPPKSVPVLARLPEPAAEQRGRAELQDFPGLQR